LVCEGKKIPTLLNRITDYKARLILDDGSIFEGKGFGFPTSVSGEIVFNTGMVGYTETLTDPSYRGQILCFTYPSIGNYGVPSQKDLDDYGLPKYFESERIQTRGLIVNNLSNVSSHWSCERFLYLLNVQLFSYLVHESHIDHLVIRNGLLESIDEGAEFFACVEDRLSPEPLFIELCDERFRRDAEVGLLRLDAGGDYGRISHFDQ